MTKIPIVPPEEMRSREEIMKIIEKKERKEYIKKLEEAMKGWRFADTSIKQMKKLNHKTKTTGIEHGSLLCGNTKNKEIDLHNECTGTECSIKIERGKCPNNKIELGTFHTHSGSKAFSFSAQDIFDEDNISCLGSPDAAKENEKLMCVVPKKESLEHERLMRRTNELLISKLSLENERLVTRTKELLISKLERVVEDEYGYLRDVNEIIEDDYYMFNPEEYKNHKEKI